MKIPIPFFGIKRELKKLEKARKEIEYIVQENRRMLAYNAANSERLRDRYSEMARNYREKGNKEQADFYMATAEIYNNAAKDCRYILNRQKGLRFVGGYSIVDEIIKEFLADCKETKQPAELLLV